MEAVGSQKHCAPPTVVTCATLSQVTLDMKPAFLVLPKYEVNGM
jgi:hypothetical protein